MIVLVSACQWSAGAEEWWAGWAGSAGIIPPPGGEEGFRGESAGTRGAARLAVRSARSGGAGCLEEAAAYFARGGAEVAPGVGGHWSPGARLPGLCWCAGGAGVPGGRATTSRRAGCRRLPPDDADWSFSSGLSSVPRTEPCGYRRVTAALRPRGRGRVGRGTVRTRPCVPRARQASAPPKGPAPPLPGRRARGSRPDLVRRGSRRQQARDEVGGRYPPVSEPGEEGSICLTTVPGLLHQEGGRVRHWGDNARHRPLVCEAIDMAARRCPTRRDKTIFHPAPGRGSPARLRPARQAPEGLRHSSFGGQDRGVLGGCPGGGRRVRP